MCTRTLSYSPRLLRILEQRVGVEVFRTVLTIDGTENKYAQWIHSTWGNVSSLDFAGFMSRDKLQDTYASTDCLVFPSRIETWGLPISEFLPYNRPMLLSDLPLLTRLQLVLVL